MTSDMTSDTESDIAFNIAMGTHLKSVPDIATEIKSDT